MGLLSSSKVSFWNLCFFPPPHPPHVLCRVKDGCKKGERRREKMELAVGGRLGNWTLVAMFLLAWIHSCRPAVYLVCVCVGGVWYGGNALGKEVETPLFLRVGLCWHSWSYMARGVFIEPEMTSIITTMATTRMKGWRQRLVPSLKRLGWLMSQWNWYLPIDI